MPVRVVLKDGAEVRGIRLNEDLFTIQLRDMSGKFHSIRKSNAELIRKETDASLMPSFAGRASDAELDDLVAYLSVWGYTVKRPMPNAQRPAKRLQLFSCSWPSRGRAHSRR